MGLCLLLVALLLTSCCPPADPVLNSLGEYDRYVYYTQGEFQDYTDYAKYYYSSARIAENDYFTNIQETDAARFYECLENFESWLATYAEYEPSCEIVVNYDFDQTIVDATDYIHIEWDKYDTTWDDGRTTTTLAGYDVYFFDTQTQVLYYFHNNI